MSSPVLELFLAAGGPVVGLVFGCDIGDGNGANAAKLARPFCDDILVLQFERVASSQPFRDPDEGIAVLLASVCCRWIARQ